jgi:outer membrane protein TolC
MLSHTALFAQLTVEACYEKARNNYPQIRQYELTEKSKEYDLANANKGYLPQFSLSAKASWQSETVELPFSIPGIEFDGLPKDQYQVAVEVNQTIWDGGTIRSQKKITNYSSEVEKQKIEVELYALRERVNQLFFGILLLNEQLKQVDLLQEELKNSYNKISSLIESGLSNQSDLDVIRVEQLKANQRKTELQTTTKAYKEMLSFFIGETVSETTELIKPEILFSENTIQTNNRAELLLFDAQNNLFDSHKKSLNAFSMPKIGLFAQAGYGQPGLNMLKDEFSPFFIGGIRLNWNLGNLYTNNNSHRKIELSKQNVQIQRDIFLFNTNLKISQQSSEIRKMQEVIRSDDEIIMLRRNIKEATRIKMENGILSTTDLVREINAENTAIQGKILHEMQLLINIENLRITTNN